MKQRNSLQTAFAVTAVLTALVFAGCGDDKTTSGATAAGGATPATQTAGGSTGATPAVTAATGATGDAATGGATAGTYGSTVNAALARGYQACLAGAKQIADSARRNQVTAQCKTAYKNAQQAAKNSSKAMKNASADCLKNAQAISNPKVRAQVLDNCEKLGK